MVLQTTSSAWSVSWNSFDWVLAATFAISVLTAFIQGFFVEIASAIGLVAGLLVAGAYYQPFAAELESLIHHPSVAAALAFLLIALGCMLVASLVGRLLRSVFRGVGLGWLDRIAGALFGVIKGGILVILLIWVTLAFFPGRGWVTGSQLAPYFVRIAHRSAILLPEELGSRIRQGARYLRLRPALVLLRARPERL